MEFRVVQCVPVPPPIPPLLELRAHRVHAHVEISWRFPAIRTVPWWSAALVAVPLVAACGARAQSNESSGPLTGAQPVARQLPLWEVGVGVAALRLPDYRGSDQSSNYLLPLPYVVYRGEFLRADREGARAVLLDVQRFEVDVSVAAAAPARNNAARAGMTELAARIEIGPSANSQLWISPDRGAEVELRAPLRTAYTLESSPRNVGWTFNPHVNLDLRGVAGGWDVGLQTGAVLADRRFHEYLYGVRPADATAQRPAYAARAGYAGWQAIGGLSRRFKDHWVGAFVRYDSLRGAVIESSPLVKSHHSLMFGVGASWIFNVSDRLVTVER